MLLLTLQYVLHTARRRWRIKTLKRGGLEQALKLVQWLVHGWVTEQIINSSLSTTFRVQSHSWTLYWLSKGFSFRDHSNAFKGQVASISSKSATNFFSDYWRSSSSKPTPFHLDWHQYAHIFRNLSLESVVKPPKVKLLTVKTKPFQRFLLVTAASLRFRPPAL